MSKLDERKAALAAARGLVDHLATKGHAANRERQRLLTAARAGDFEATDALPDNARAVERLRCEHDKAMTALHQAQNELNALRDAQVALLRKERDLENQLAGAPKNPEALRPHIIAIRQAMTEAGYAHDSELGGMMAVLENVLLVAPVRHRSELAEVQRELAALGEDDTTQELRGRVRGSRHQVYAQRPSR